MQNAIQRATHWWYESVKHWNVLAVFGESQLELISSGLQSAHHCLQKRVGKTDLRSFMILKFEVQIYHRRVGEYFRGMLAEKNRDAHFFEIGSGLSFVSGLTFSYERCECIW